MRGLTGKRVIVTGGTSGIGEATARRFLEEGAHVAVLALDDVALATVHERLPELAGAIGADVADRAQVARAFREVDRLFGGLDVLIANAGLSIRHRFLDISPAGVVLITASTNALVGHPGYADYNASKAGLLALTRTMALELAPHVRVDAVCPGYVLTPMQRAEYSPEALAAVDGRLPIGRHAEPDEIAALFAFLASDEAAYLTGAAIPIDGGETAGGLASRE